MMRFLVINGPNINMLGIREPGIYGRESYERLLEMIDSYARRNQVEIETFQSNHEGSIVDRIQQAYFDKIDGIVINPAAYTHTSVAILDALKACSINTVEVHISDISAREDFRKKSFVSSYALKVISGRGLEGYIEALDTLLAVTRE